MTHRTHLSQHRHKLLLTAALLVGFGLRLYKLGEQSLWYDETVSAILARQSTIELIAHTARDIHPPGYYLLLHFWTTLTGDTEFALGYFSLVFGILIIAGTYRIARYLTHRQIAVWAAWLVAFSSYNVWYSQEVRMYTLGAFLGLVATYCLLRALKFTPTRHPKLYWSGYIISAAIGLYTLYYFAFLLIPLNLTFLAYTLWPKIKRRQLIGLLISNSLVFLIYLPWLPVAWRQVSNPPVPAWRSFAGLWPVLVESWSTLSLGQSVEPSTVWFVLLPTVALFILGVYALTKPAFQRRPLVPWLLVGYTFVPLLLIYALSFITPLYHVRYIFTYSPAFYIILGAGLAWLTLRTRLWVALVVALTLWSASIYSLYQFHFDPRYQSDDYRRAVNFIEQQWQPNDVIMANAGYAYTAFLYYTNLPNIERQRLSPYLPPTNTTHPYLLTTGTVDGDSRLGWNNPQSDFYAMSAAETIVALEEMANGHNRLWLLRAYDTVTDPNGIIRAWLAENAVLIEDELFAGESNMRVQGFLLNKNPQLQGETVDFEDGMVLTGWTLPQQPWQPGQTIPVQLGWTITAAPHTDYKMSLKLWNENGELAGQGEDTWPVGTYYRATNWLANKAVYQPTQIILPVDIPPGRYWLNVELYNPDTMQPLHRLDGTDPVVTLGPVVVQ